MKIYTIFAFGITATLFGGTQFPNFKSFDYGAQVAKAGKELHQSFPYVYDTEYDYTCTVDDLMKQNSGLTIPQAKTEAAMQLQDYVDQQKCSGVSARSASAFPKKR